MIENVLPTGSGLSVNVNRKYKSGPRFGPPYGDVRSPITVTVYGTHDSIGCRTMPLVSSPVNVQLPWRRRMRARGGRNLGVNVKTHDRCDNGSPRNAMGPNAIVEGCTVAVLMGANVATEIVLWSYRVPVRGR